MKDFFQIAECSFILCKDTNYFQYRQQKISPVLRDYTHQQPHKSLNNTYKIPPEKPLQNVKTG